MAEAKTMTKVLKIKVNRVPELEYLTAGQVMVAYPGKHHVRVRREDDSAGTYVATWVFEKALKDGSFEVVA